MNTEKDEPYARIGVVEQQILSNCPPRFEKSLNCK